MLSIRSAGGFADVRLGMLEGGDMGMDCSLSEFEAELDRVLCADSRDESEFVVEAFLEVLDLVFVSENLDLSSELLVFELPSLWLKN